MDQKIAVKMILLVLIIVLGGIAIRMDFSGMRNGNWLALLSLILVVNFNKERRKWMRGENSAWNDLTLKDKALFMFSTTILFVFALWPIKDEWHFGALFLSVIVGLGISMFITYKFGTDALKEFMLPLSMSD